MPRKGFVVLALLSLLPVSAQAQQWTAAQQEVWQALEACWSPKTIETAMACIHDDYVSFQTAEGVPQNKTDLRATMAHFLETEEQVWVYRKPLNIDVRGNVAVVLYVVDFLERNKATGKETTGKYNWTEVFVKDGGTWKALTDHGTKVGGS